MKDHSLCKPLISTISAVEWDKDTLKVFARRFHLMKGPLKDLWLLHDWMVGHGYTQHQDLSSFMILIHCWIFGHGPIYKQTWLVGKWTLRICNTSKETSSQLCQLMHWSYTFYYWFTTLVFQIHTEKVFWVGFLGPDTSSQGAWKPAYGNDSFVHVFSWRCTLLKIGNRPWKGMNHLNQPFIFQGFQLAVSFREGTASPSCSFRFWCFWSPFADVSMVHGMRLFLLHVHIFFRKQKWIEKT